MTQDLLLIARAADFAARRHAAQRLKGVRDVPYVNHLTEVVALLAATEGGRHPELLAAGYLHDVVEDGHATAGEIEMQFGSRVRGIVIEMTDDMTLPEAERRRQQVADIPSKSSAARLMKLADKVSKVREMAEDPPSDWSQQELSDYVEWCIAVVDAGCRNLDRELERQFDEAAARFRSS